MGGVISWAVEPTTLAFGEGFEVSFRDEPGPVEGCEDEESPERDPGDFVLSFRRGSGAWHFTAGSRSRSSCGAQKAIQDTSVCSKTGQRHMFWAACLECGFDGKHYLVVGTVPGLLTAHFFVAKVARSLPLSHVGFSYLPMPKDAAFGSDVSIGTVSQIRDVGPQPLLIESITVFPHGLSGELPFVSHRFLKVLSDESGQSGHDGIDVSSVAEWQLPVQKQEERQQVSSRLLLLKRPSTESEAVARQRLESWCEDAKRELGLASLFLHKRSLVEDPEDDEGNRSSPSTAGKRRRAAAMMLRVDRSLADSAMLSWAPEALGSPRLGPFDESLRHVEGGPAAAGRCVEQGWRFCKREFG